MKRKYEGERGQENVKIKARTNSIKRYCGQMLKYADSNSSLQKSSKFKRDYQCVLEGHCIYKKFLWTKKK
eukprot:UN08355